MIFDVQPGQGARQELQVVVCEVRQETVSFSISDDPQAYKFVRKVMKEWSARFVFGTELELESNEFGGVQGCEHFRLEI